MFKFGIVGLGFIAPRHIQAIERIGGTLVWGCDIDPLKKDILPEGVGFYEDYTKTPNVDYVVVCTPNYLHFEMAKFFTGKGSQVILEKPPAIDFIDTLLMVDMPVWVMFQLRHHPKLNNIRLKNKGNSIAVVAKMFRDDKYWNGWKGDKEKSGGILYNLGVHYIDLLCHLLGNVVDVEESNLGVNIAGQERFAFGDINFKNGTASYWIEIISNKDNQTRALIVNDETIELSNQDNLSYEDLHYKVYQDIIEGKGIRVGDVVNTMRLLKDLYDKV